MQLIWISNKLVWFDISLIILWRSVSTLKAPKFIPLTKYSSTLHCFNVTCEKRHWRYPGIICFFDSFISIYFWLYKLDRIKQMFHNYMKNLRQHTYRKIIIKKHARTKILLSHDYIYLTNQTLHQQAKRQVPNCVLKITGRPRYVRWGWKDKVCLRENNASIHQVQLHGRDIKLR